MTTIVDTAAPAIRQADTNTRVWNVVRLQFTNRWNMLVLPWLVLAFIFGINYAFWAIIAFASKGEASLSGTQYTGATFFIFVYMLILAIQAINGTFPFALGYSVTRRDYYLGTSLAFTMQSAAFTVAFVIFSYVEEWTHGWGLGGHMFTAIYFGQGALWERLFGVFVAFLFCFAIGTFAATVYVKWRLNGMIAFSGGMTALLLGAVAAITLTRSWGVVGEWFVAVGPTGFLAWLLVPTLLMGVAGFFILRRATPKS